MQTFVPYEDFYESARVLDNKRLGKQRVETKQILNVLYTGSRGAWSNHPATRMWAGHEGVLLQYQAAVCFEWILRGFKHTLVLDEALVVKFESRTTKPFWLGHPLVHRSHRQTLKYKDPVAYSVFTEEPKYEYVWPVNTDYSRNPLLL
jgi:hypothetical protein